jgi:hypothetical protein
VDYVNGMEREMSNGNGNPLKYQRKKELVKI